MQDMRRRTKAAAADFAHVGKRGAAAERRPSKDAAQEVRAVAALTRVLEVVTPYADAACNAATAAWDALERHHAHDLLVAFYGFALCFFGGVFMTVVAAIEAAHLFGWEKISAAVRKLHGEWRAARLAFEADNRADDDRDGVRDVDEMDARALATRRLLVLSRSVDPDALSMALEGLSCACLAVLATLRVRFAAAITLGTAIGDTVLAMCGPVATAGMAAVLPDEYERWIPVLCRYGARYVGVSLSWMLMRVTSSVFSSMRGSSLMITGVAAYLVGHGRVDRNDVKSGEPMLMLVWGAVGLLGFYWQASSGFQLRFPVNVLLLPVTIVEKVLVAVVGSKTV
jgi:hypothetical protein